MLPPYLHQAIPNKRHQQLLPPPLPDQRGVLGTVHAGEVEHGHIRLAGVVLSKLEVGQFAPRGEGGGVTGVQAQRLVIDVCRSQQLFSVAVVLWRDRDRDRDRSDESWHRFCV